MSSDAVVRLVGVGKDYVARDGGSALAGLLGRRSARSISALDDIDAEFPAGSTTALLGPNGAGKSTLLQLIAGVTRPSRGLVHVGGSVGALIEVGSGIHPELTGAENIKLYGRILGMSRRQVRDRFDAIADFAELGAAIDQQVKYYSSGMRLRLGFSIAAHLEPDIMLIDEALSVGDAAFQRRCVGRIRELLGRGCTLVYVSHDLKSVEAICDRAVRLDSGRLVEAGPCRPVLERYIADDRRQAASTGVGRPPDGAISLESVDVFDHADEPTATVRSGRPVRIELGFRSGPLRSPHVAVGISSGGPRPLAVCSMAEHGSAPSSVDGRWVVRLEIDRLPLRAGAYELWLNVLGDDCVTDLFAWSRVAGFQVASAMGAGKRGATEEGPLVLDHKFVANLGVGSAGMEPEPTSRTF